MIPQLQTYGQQNLFVREYQKIKSFYVVDQKVQQKFSHLQFYAPGIQRYKLCILGVATAVCFSTLGTNWMLPFIYRRVLK